MRKIALVFCIIVLASFSQRHKGSEEYVLMINLESVNQIYIAAKCSPVDSCRSTLYLLNDTMTEDLIDRLNKSASKTPCSNNTEYLLSINLKNGSQRYFEINGSSIKENSDRCFDIIDSVYFKNLWIELDNK